MPVSLSRKKVDPKKVDLKTVSDNRKFRMDSVRRELDTYYDEVAVRARASQLGYPYVDLYAYPISTGDLALYTKSEVEAYEAGCFKIEKDVALIATPSPKRLLKTNFLDRLADKEYDYKIFICSQNSIHKLIDAYRSAVEVKQVSDGLNIDQQEIKKFLEQKTRPQDIFLSLDDYSISQIIEKILTLAIQYKASDIHFQPEKNFLNLKLRIDGVLHQVGQIKKDLQDKVESRIKILGRLKLNIDSTPQDGRFSFKVGQQDIDVRVSLLPSNFGYSMVLRLLGNDTVDLKIEALGFASATQNLVKQALTRPQGLILVCGPTGSGKTTSLYTFLQILNQGDRKIVTIENPIEYKLKGISQTQVDIDAGYGFAQALKSILRQDPDVVMVGEIRDEETAKTAIEASLTGHLVLSTVHTNNAVGALTRLLEMGVKGYLLADALTMVIGQRLLRKICVHCLQPDDISLEDQDFLLENVRSLPQKYKQSLPKQVKLKTSKGCDQCNGFAYKGRVGVYEVFVNDSKIKEFLSVERPSVIDIRRYAQAKGMLTMTQDGVLKVFEGITDVKETRRILI
jgi:type II secretory ATPase GspE/PulE/Tfp pilus assembly ATPase PilB-like protein